MVKTHCIYGEKNKTHQFPSGSLNNLNNDYTLKKNLLTYPFNKSVQPQNTGLRYIYNIIGIFNAISSISKGQSHAISWKTSKIVKWQYVLIWQEKTRKNCVHERSIKKIAAISLNLSIQIQSNPASARASLMPSA